MKKRDPGLQEPALFPVFSNIFKGNVSIPVLLFDVCILNPFFQDIFFEDSGLPYFPKLVHFPPHEAMMSARDMGYEGAKCLLQSGAEIDAIMAAGDPIAMGAIKYLKQLGVRMPEDIRVTGFDNNEFCEIIEPTLTTIAQPIGKIGKMAAQILFNKIGGSASEERVFFNGELIQRDST